MVISSNIGKTEKQEEVIQDPKTFLFQINVYKPKKELLACVIVIVQEFVFILIKI
jgi:hypothetical protein